MWITHIYTMHAGVSTFHVWHDNKVTDHHSHNSTATGIYIEHVTYTTTETGMSPFNKYIFKMKGYARFHQHSAKWGQTLYCVFKQGSGVTPPMLSSDSFANIYTTFKYSLNSSPYSVQVKILDCL